MPTEKGLHTAKIETLFAVDRVGGVVVNPFPLDQRTFAFIPSDHPLPVAGVVMRIEIDGIPLTGAVNVGTQASEAVSGNS